MVADRPYGPRRILLPLLALLLSLPASADKLVLLSPHSDEIQNEFSAAFEQHYEAQTGRPISLEWLDVGGGTSSIMRYIKGEFVRTPQSIEIDLFFGGGLDPYTELAEMGLFEAYRLPDDLLDRVPARIGGGIPVYDAEYRWYGATLAGFGIVYNRKVLDILGFPVPDSWEDLGEPKYASWVGSGDPRFSGSVHMAYELILQAYGWEKGWEVITRMGANVRNFGASGSAAPKDVAVGEVAYGLSIDFYAWAQMKDVGDDFVGFTMPDNMTIVNPDGIAILKGAPNPEPAREFIRFVMSEPGQKLWFFKQGAPGGPVNAQLNRFTVVPELYDRYRDEAAVTLNPFSWRSDLAYDSAKASARWSVLNDLIGVLVIDSHDRLRAAWSRAQSGGLTDEEIRSLCAVPVSEAAALELGRTWRSDPRLRIEKLDEWSAFAREKYGEGRTGWSRTFDVVTLVFPLLIAVCTVVMVRRTGGV